MTNTTYTPSILQYIPFFYVIWSDDLLTASETSVVQLTIHEDNALSTEEKSLLQSWLHRDNPPSNDIIKEWKRIITNSNLKLIESNTYPLTSFSKQLVKGTHEAYSINDHLKHIEIHLGIQPNHYNHLFDIEVVHEKTSHFYNADELDHLLLGNHKDHIIKFREFIEDPMFNWHIDRDKDSFRKTVLNQVAFLGKNHYGTMAYPQAYGGINNMPAYSHIFEHLMYVDGSLTIKFGVQVGLFGGSIQKLGTKKHHDRYLQKAGETKLLGCFAMTETGHGSNVRGVKTTATYILETDSLIIHTPGKNDNKEYIGNALHSKMATVFAQLIVKGKNQGVHAILVPLRNDSHELLPGIKIEDNGYKLGLNGVDNGKIWFNQVQVPRENLLDKFGEITDEGDYYSDIQNPNKRFFTMLGTLVGGRICVARAGLGGAKMALTIAIKHALKRRQFNDSVKIQEDLLMDYPTHQLRLIPMVAASYVYSKTLDYIVEQYDSNTSNDKRKIETQVAGLKSVITWYANTTIQECREACGGKGYLLENRIGDLKNDVDIFTTFEGDNTVLLQLTAKGILSDFNSEFNSAGFSTVLKLLSSQLNDKISTISPTYTNKVDKAHLFNPKFHTHAFNYRTRRLTYTLAQRIRAYIKKGIPAYQAFLKVQDHLLALGKAYSIELSHSTFLNYINTIENEKNKELFYKLGTLYALDEINKDAVWYLQQGYIGATKSKAIRSRVERLCSELRPHIEVLVDGYGIPDRCLTAPIAR